MSDFTPGKWEVRELLSGFAVFAENEGKREAVADCLDNEANARLIAAAPEMYDLLDFLDCIQHEEDSIFLMERVHTLIARIDGKEETNDL